MNKTKAILLAVLTVGILAGAVIGRPRPSHACQDIECAKNACLSIDAKSSCHSARPPAKCQDLDCILLRHPCQLTP